MSENADDRRASCTGARPCRTVVVADSITRTGEFSRAASARTSAGSPPCGSTASVTRAGRGRRSGSGYFAARARLTRTAPSNTPWP